MEYANGGRNYFLCVTLKDGIVTTQKTQTLHLELLILRINIKESFVKPK